jgi:hypothetical protein
MDEAKDKSPEWIEHGVIYLQPACMDCILLINGTSEGRLWCQNPQEPCEECGKEWSKYHLQPAP